MTNVEWIISKIFSLIVFIKLLKINQSKWPLEKQYRAFRDALETKSIGQPEHIRHLRLHSIYVIVLITKNSLATSRLIFTLYDLICVGKSSKNLQILVAYQKLMKLVNLFYQSPS